MVGEREVLVAELDGLAGHRLDRRAAVGPVGVQVEVAAERGPDLAAGAGVGRGLAPRAGRGTRATSPASAWVITRAVLSPMPGRSLSRPASDELAQLGVGTVADGVGGAAERLLLVAAGAAALEQGRDALEGFAARVIREPYRRARRSPTLELLLGGMTEWPKVLAC